jgi:PTS system galactitol-specific IIA component
METVVQSKLKIEKNLVHVFNTSVTREEAINTLATHLLENGYVKDSFAKAVLEREKVFPTGLPTEPVGVAIPHTDAEHVLASALAVGILSHPVTFLEMGSLDVTVDVHIISMMAISDPKAVMPVLRNLALAYQDHEFLASLKNSRDQQMVLDLFKTRIPDVIELV